MGYFVINFGDAALDALTTLPRQAISTVFGDAGEAAGARARRAIGQRQWGVIK